MYLSFLEEKEKKLFLGLAYQLVRADGEITEKEEKMIETYCQEMNIQGNVLNEGYKIEDIILELMSCREQKKLKIIIFEIIGLAMVDGEYHIHEKKIINKLVDKFKIDIKFVLECKNLIEEYIKLQNKINNMVLS